MSVRFFKSPTPPAGKVHDGDRWNDPTTGRRYRFRAGRGWVRFVDQRARNKWKASELQILAEHFPVGGVDACAPLLPRRCRSAIESRARKERLLGPNGPRWLQLALAGADLEEAIRLRDVEGWGYPRIGKRFGISEGGATNAILITKCRLGGFVPAERDAHGALTERGIAQLRQALRKGWKGHEISLRLGVSASTVSRERRLYSAYLKANRKAPLPPPGRGGRYSGARISRELRLKAEATYLAGHGTPKVVRETGISNTQALRIRAKLIRRLGRKGECLPNCDRAGVRRTYVDSRQRIPPEKIAEVRGYMLEGISHVRAANLAGIGDASAYQIKKTLQAELAANGQALPPTRRVGKGAAKATRWLPPGARWIFLYRKLLAEHGDEAAKQIIAEGIETLAALPRAIARAISEAERQRPQTLERQLERLRSGAALVPTFVPSKALREQTLGGVATAQL